MEGVVTEEQYYSEYQTPQFLIEGKRWRDHTSEEKAEVRQEQAKARQAAKQTQWFHVSKTYRWDNLLKRFLANPGETYKVQPQSQRSMARKMGITTKRFRKLAKLARRREREAANA